MKNKLVAAFTFDFLTPFYDSITEIIGYGQSFKETIIRLLGLKDGENLIDVGCGTDTLLVLAHLYPIKKIANCLRAVGSDGLDVRTSGSHSVIIIS